MLSGAIASPVQGEVGRTLAAEPVGLLLQRRFKIVPMRIFRLPDRKLPTKP